MKYWCYYKCCIIITIDWYSTISLEFWKLFSHFGVCSFVRMTIPTWRHETVNRLVWSNYDHHKYAANYILLQTWHITRTLLKFANFPVQPTIIIMILSSSNTGQWLSKIFYQNNRYVFLCLFETYVSGSWYNKSAFAAFTLLSSYWFRLHYGHNLSSLIWRSQTRGSSLKSSSNKDSPLQLSRAERTF